MEVSTPEKSEVLAITARMGGDDTDITVGRLFRLWRWFDQQTTDGNAHGVTQALLDRVIGVTGFCEAVQSVGWLVVNEGGISLPNFDRHNGSTAKNRAQTAKRVAKYRVSPSGDDESNGESVTSIVTPALAREEKRREEKKESTTDVVDTPRKRSSVPAKPSDVDQQTWDDFLAMRNKMRAAVTQTAIDGIAREADKAGITLGDAMGICCTNGWRGFKADWLARQGGAGRQGFGVNKQELIEQQNQAALEQWLAGKGDVIDA